MRTKGAKSLTPDEKQLEESKETNRLLKRLIKTIKEATKNE